MDPSTPTRQQPAESNEPRGSSSSDDATLPVHQVAYHRTKEDASSFEVEFGPNDPQNPFNWSRRRRWYITFVAGLLAVNASFGSSVPSGIVPQMMAQFGFGREVGTLTIALFVAGYCVGPLLWGPLSEQYGRKYPTLLTFVAYTGFSIGCALSPNTASILVFRFLSGTFAASGLVISGALMSDIWDANTRGKAFSLFTVAPFAGPTLAPMVSGFIAVSGTSWRWAYWVVTIFAGTCVPLVFFTIPETYSPVLLARKAKKLRDNSGDDRYWAPLEKESTKIGAEVQRILGTPFALMVKEPMLIALTMYMSFIYGVIYLLFEAYPIVFTTGHHMNAGITGLMFLPILVSSNLAVIGYLLIWNPRYERLARQHAPNPVPPEYRLEQAIWAAPLFAVSFFWFGWTSYPSVSFWAPMLAGGLLGFSIVWLFLALFNYIIDAYLAQSASALAANTVVRSLFGAGFPLFAAQMFEHLSPRWASTLLGCIALVMTPIPLVLFRFGPTLRARSQYARKRPDSIAKTPAGVQVA
ncbi:MFS general substrate transporter [Phanerochaete sordida]|uniref:MFS general substrate transporter n=1 Tax=Phanerochaete sordida TaxID=48140 RepID=A0A9P3GSR5_9APHY|nr:MFS general substrate transporter [Phanerochaete sordida]